MIADQDDEEERVEDDREQSQSGAEESDHDYSENRSYLYCFEMGLVRTSFPPVLFLLPYSLLPWKMVTALTCCVLFNYAALDISSQPPRAIFTHGLGVYEAG